MFSVLFLCTGNACRSQMAEGWLRELAGDRFEALSAGTEPHGLNARAVASMAAAGVDISAQRSQHLDEFMPPVRPAPDLVIAVCSNAADACPVFPGATQVLRWPFPDPAPGGVDAGADEAAIMVNFDRVRDSIRAGIEAWLASGAAALDQA